MAVAAAAAQERMKKEHESPASKAEDPSGLSVEGVPYRIKAHPEEGTSVRSKNTTQVLRTGASITSGSPGQ